MPKLIFLSFGLLKTMYKFSLYILSKSDNFKTLFALYLLSFVVKNRILSFRFRCKKSYHLPLLFYRFDTADLLLHIDAFYLVSSCLDMRVIMNYRSTYAHVRHQPKTYYAFGSR